MLFGVPPSNPFLDELAMLDSLPQLTAEARRTRDVDLTGQAKAIGVTPATLVRFEAAGAKPTLATVRRVLTYLAKQ